MHLSLFPVDALSEFHKCTVCSFLKDFAAIPMKVVSLSSLYSIVTFKMQFVLQNTNQQAFTIKYLERKKDFKFQILKRFLNESMQRQQTNFLLTYSMYDVLEVYMFTGL